MSYRVFNLDELAGYLHVDRTDIEQLVRRNEIPHRQQGDRVVFLQGEIDGWASRRLLGLSAAELMDFHKVSSAKVHDLSARHAIIPELMRAEHIEPALASKTKHSVIRDMVELAGRTGLLNYPEDLLTHIQERERMCSTALAGGIAILHSARHEPYMAEDSFIVLARSVQPVPFGSPDGRTTDIFFLLCAQDDRIHLHLLARICMLCYHTSMLLDLRMADDAASILGIIVSAEKAVIEEL